MNPIHELLEKRYDLNLSNPTRPGYPDPKHPVAIPQMSREDLASLFMELGFRQGAEIGVEQGAFSKVLCSSNPTVKLFCVDAWAHYSGYRDHVDQKKLDGFYEKTAERLKDYDATLCRGYSAEVAPKFKDKSLDFVYIDANHSLPYVIQDIHLWGAKVRSGGIISGHDYIRYNREKIQCHVVEAVHAWTVAYRISPWFVLGSPTKHPEMENGKTGRTGTCRSWMWVKP